MFGITNTTTECALGRFGVSPAGFAAEAWQAGIFEPYGIFGNLLRCTDTLCVTTNAVVLDPIRMERVRVLEDGYFPNHTLLALDAAHDRAYFYLPAGAATLPAGIHAYEISSGKRMGSLGGTFPQSDMQLLATGELILTGPEGIALVPAALVK